MFFLNYLNVILKYKYPLKIPLIIEISTDLNTAFC